MSTEVAELQKLVRELNTKVVAQEIVLKLLNAGIIELRKQMELDEQWLSAVSRLAQHALQHADFATSGHKQEDEVTPALPKKPGERDIEVA